MARTNSALWPSPSVSNLYDKLYQILHVSSSVTLRKWIEMFIQLFFVGYISSHNRLFLCGTKLWSGKFKPKFKSIVHQLTITSFGGDHKIAMHLPPRVDSLWSPLEVCITTRVCFTRTDFIITPLQSCHIIWFGLLLENFLESLEISFFHLPKGLKAITFWVTVFHCRAIFQITIKWYLVCKDSSMKYTVRIFCHLVYKCLLHVLNMEFFSQFCQCFYWQLQEQDYCYKYVII